MSTKNAIYTAAVPEPIQKYTRLPCVRIKSLFTRQPFKSHIGDIHCCRVYTKIVIYTAAVQVPNRLYRFLPGNNKLNTIKLVLLNLIKMTSNAAYVAHRAEEFDRSRLAFCITKRHMISINSLRLEKTCYASGFFVCFVFCFRNNCRVNTCTCIHFILEAQQQCI